MCITRVRTLSAQSKIVQQETEAHSSKKLQAEGLDSRQLTLRGGFFEYRTQSPLPLLAPTINL